MSSIAPQPIRGLRGTVSRGPYGTGIGVLGRRGGRAVRRRILGERRACREDQRHDEHQIGDRADALALLRGQRHLVTAIDNQSMPRKR